MADNSAPPASSSGMAAAGEVANPRACPCPFRDIRLALGVTASMASRDIRSAGSDDIRLAGSGVANPTARSPRAIIAPATGAAVDAPRSTMLYRDIRLAGSEGIRVAGSGVANPSASSPPATVAPATAAAVDAPRPFVRYRDIRLAGSEGILVAGSGVANPSASVDTATMVIPNDGTLEEVTYRGGIIEEVRHHNPPPNPRSASIGAFHFSGGRKMSAEYIFGVEKGKSRMNARWDKEDADDDAKEEMEMEFKRFKKAREKTASEATDASSSGTDGSSVDNR
jgi:hypothetical protein